VLELYFLYYSFLYIRYPHGSGCSAKKEKKIDEEWTVVKGSRSRVLNLPRLFLENLSNVLLMKPPLLDEPPDSPDRPTLFTIVRKQLE
jgi:hypothetical protein